LFEENLYKHFPKKVKETMVLISLTPTYRAPIRAVKEKFPHLKEHSEKFRFLVIEESQKYPLNLENVKQLASFLRIRHNFVPNQYFRWTPSLSNLMSCIKYTNPANSKEYILDVPSKKNLYSTEILHHVPDQGFTAVDVFKRLTPLALPDLNDLKKNFYNDFTVKHPNVLGYDTERQGKAIRGVFSKSVSKPINTTPDLDPYAIRLIHAFFEIIVPEIDDICSKCFKVSMPESGFGIKYLNKIADNLYYEVRLSPEKLGGQNQQSQIYITNKLNVHGKVRFVEWQQTNEPVYNFTEDITKSITHIPYRHNDQESIFSFLNTKESIDYFKKLSSKAPNLIIPICQCHLKT
jgi:hypothetical protein